MADILINPNDTNLYYDDPAMRRLVNHAMVNQKEPLEKALEALQSQEALDEWTIVTYFYSLVHRVNMYLFSSYAADYNAAVEKVHLFVTQLLKEHSEANTPISAQVSPVETEQQPVNPATDTGTKPTISEAGSLYATMAGLMSYLFSYIINAEKPSTLPTDKEITDASSPSTSASASNNESVKSEKAEELTPKSLNEKILLIKNFITASSTFAEVAKLYPKSKESSSHGAANSSGNVSNSSESTVTT